jgi:putative PIN family toxin of toxin-antitoxin system
MNSAKPGGLRVVSDTNVHVSAFTHRLGPPFRIWQKAISREYTLLTSPAIMREVARVLRNRMGWQETEIVSQLKLLARVAKIVSPTEILRVVKADPDDDRIIECAVSGNADLIVSGDHHLTKLKSYRNIGIVRPIDFLRTLGA